jgi:hypothetical protein
MSNAAPIFSVAVDSLKRINAPPRKGNQMDALVSIVFAAASLEAFLNEAAYLASNYQPVVGDPVVVSTFADVMEEVEKSRAQIQAKFQFAHIVLTGKTYDKGAAPYQDFSLLIETRNELVHFKSDEYFLSKGGDKATVGSTVRVIRRLKSLNILFEGTPGTITMPFGQTAQMSAHYVTDPIFKEPPDASASFTYLIGTKAVAEWACNAASQMVLDFLSKAPPSTWKNRMDTYLLPAFSVPLK